MKPLTKVRKFNLHPERIEHDHCGIRRHKPCKPSGRQLDQLLRGRP